MDTAGEVDGDLVVTRRVLVPAAELHWRFSRASGPGGQGVNTTDSRVELTVDVARCRGLDEAGRARLLERLAGRLRADGRLTVVATEHRSQWRNRTAARDRLAALLRTALAPPPAERRARGTSRGAQRRRLEAKRARSDRKRLRRAPDGRGSDD